MMWHDAKGVKRSMGNKAEEAWGETVVVVSQTLDNFL